MCPVLIGKSSSDGDKLLSVHCFRAGAPCGPVDPFLLRTFIREWLSSSPDASDSLLYLPLIPLPTPPVNNRPCRPIPDTPILNVTWLRNDKLHGSRVLALVMSVRAGNGILEANV